MTFIRLGSTKSRHSWEGFNLNNDQCTNDLKRLVDSSGISQVSIHVELDGEVQKRTLYGPHSQQPSTIVQPRNRSQLEVYATGEAPSNREVANTPQSSEDEIDKSGAKNIYAIASLTKILVNVAYSKLIFQGLYKNKDLSWDKSACDLFNEVRRAHGKSLIRRFARDPTILELLLHRNGFAPMNRVLLAPDGTFLMSEEEFLEIAPRLTEDYFRGGKQGWCEYSNANHIFAGIILEEITGRRLSEIMKEIVFDPLQMTLTVMDKPSLLQLEAAGAIIAEGHRVSGDMTQLIPILERKYLTDTVEVAPLGARSCTEDLAKLIRELLMALDNVSSKFQEQEVLYFFGPKCDFHDGGKVTLGGLYCALDSTLSGSESLNKILVPSNEFPPYTLGRPPNESQSHSYYNAGSIDGFTSSMYVSLKRRLFVIVLSNSTGPMDVTDHIARYVLQSVLKLAPPVDIINKAIEEGRRASRRVQEYERKDEDLLAWSDDMKGLVGTYKSVKHGQELEILKEGHVFLRRKGKSSSQMEARVSGSTLRIFPGPEGFGIERWSVWDNRDFRMQESNGKAFLIGIEGEDRYQRTTLF